MMGLWQFVWESGPRRAQEPEQQDVGCYTTRSNLVPLNHQGKVARLPKRITSASGSQL